MTKIYRVQMNSNGMPNFSTAVEIADRPRGEVDAVKEYEHQAHNLDQGYITLGEFDKRIEPLRHLHYDRPQGEWIPCSERLPNEGEVVLVCMRIESHKAEWEEQRSIEFGRISSDRYDFNGTGWEWLNESGADYWQADWNNSILAWMPLPKPYGEREGE